MTAVSHETWAKRMAEVRAMLRCDLHGVRAVALAPPERVGVAEAGRAREMDGKTALSREMELVGSPLVSFARGGR